MAELVPRSSTLWILRHTASRVVEGSLAQFSRVARETKDARRKKAAVTAALFMVDSTY
jgi:hypothetical protein